MALKSFASNQGDAKKIHVAGKILGKHMRLAMKLWKVYMVILDESGVSCVIVEHPLIEEANKMEIGDIVIIYNPTGKSAWVRELGCNYFILVSGGNCKLDVIKAGSDESAVLGNLPQYARIGTLSVLSVLNTTNVASNYHYHFFGKLTVDGDSQFLSGKALTLWNLKFTDQEGNTINVTLYNDLCSQAYRYKEEGDVFVFMLGCTKHTFGTQDAISVSIVPNLIIWNAETCIDYEANERQFMNARRLELGHAIVEVRNPVLRVTLFELTESPSDNTYSILATVEKFLNPQYVIYMGCPRLKCYLVSMRQGQDGLYRCKTCIGTFGNTAGLQSPTTCGKFLLVIRDTSECDVSLFGPQLLRFYKKLGMTAMVEKLAIWTTPYEQYIQPLLGKEFMLKIKKKNSGMNNMYSYSVNDMVRITVFSQKFMHSLCDL